jgi:crotonobetaine/carnitine-CoA ligase
MTFTLNQDELVLGEVLRARARQSPEKTCCSVPGRIYSFADMDAKADDVAAGFASLGIEKGDRVAVLLPNVAEALELFFGLARLGAIQVPLNAFLKGEFLRHQLSQSRTSVLVTDAAGAQAVAPLLSGLSDLTHLVFTEEVGAFAAEGLGVHGYVDVLAAGEQAPVVEIAPTDTLAIIFTSGTTGLPKGCVHSHGYSMRCGAATAYGIEIGPEDVMWAPLPMFHAAGRIILTGALLNGVAFHVEPRFSASNFLPRASELGATIVVGVGSMGMALLATPASDADTAHHIHTMVVAPLSPAEQERFQTRFGIDPWTELYGQTECMPLCVTPRGGRRDRAGCGRPAPDLEVRLLDEHLREVAPGEVGEICVRPTGPFQLFDGYWDQPEATLGALGGLWYHTGDAGRVLPSGELAFVDRKKDAMRRRGENVSSIELEIAIRTHPKVVDAAVHAVPSPVTEDDIKVCLVLAPGESTDAEEMFDFFKDNLPYFALPRYVEIVDDLPRNAVNRVMKHLLLEGALDGDVWDFEALGLTVGREGRRTTGSTSGPAAS